MANYEWCIETYTNDEFQDIIDTNFSDSLTYTKSSFEANEGEKTMLVLIRNEGNEREGVTGRYWAYVENNTLPEYFTNELGEPVNIKVPVKYHAELAKNLHLLTSL